MKSYFLKLNWTALLLMVLLFNTVHAEPTEPTGPTNRVFVTNERSDSISVINGHTLEIEATLEIGKRPRGIGLSPDGSELYVAVSEENKIKVLDPVSLDILREFPAGSDPETFAVHPNGFIYISNEDDAKVSVLDPKTGTLIVEIPVGLEPEGVAISTDGEHVIVTSESSNMLHVIDAANNTIKHNILVGSRPRSATFNQEGSLAYATAEIDGQVVKADINSGKILATGSTGDEKSKPKDVLLSKNENFLYVAGGRSNEVKVMNANTLEIVKAIPVGKRVWGLAMSKDGKRVFTTDGVSGTVSVIDTDANEVIKTIAVGQFPWGVIIDD